MFAVIATGGKQYRVTPGQTLTVEKLDIEVGGSVDLSTVLVVGEDGAVKAGADVADHIVKATVSEHVLGEKIRVFTYKNKSRQHKRRGHRQHGTKITIDSI